MCHKPKSETTPVTAKREHRRGRDRSPVWENTTPRGNQELDRRDVDRSLERLHALVGR